MLCHKLWSAFHCIKDNFAVTWIILYNTIHTMQSYYMIWNACYMNHWYEMHVTWIIDMKCMLHESLIWNACYMNHWYEMHVTWIIDMKCMLHESLIWNACYMNHWYEMHVTWIIDMKCMLHESLIWNACYMNHWYEMHVTWIIDMKCMLHELLIWNALYYRVHYACVSWKSCMYALYSKCMRVCTHTCAMHVTFSNFPEH